ncbi:MAG: hypothetical protein IIY16_05180, partial [Oscillospiraceae bacterium]|nr:hypothetical protein [Oscillospiraceae bacterium]
MKRTFQQLIAILIVLAMLTVSAFAAGEITANGDGTTNIPMSDGYSGFCVNFFRNPAASGSTFTLADASIVQGNAYSPKPNVSQYIKILITQYFTDFWTIDAENETYALTNAAISDKIWTFTNMYFENTGDPYIDGPIALAAQGLTIPDNGYVLTVDENTEVEFAFRYYTADTYYMQDLIGMKAIVRYTDPDGGNPEGGNPEGGNPEGGNPEGGNPEGGNPEGGNPEGGNPEGGNPEGGNPEGGNPEGGN